MTSTTTSNSNSKSNNPLQNTHVKLLAFDLNTLTHYQPQPPLHSLTSPQPTFLRKSKLPITFTESLGTVTTRDYKPDKFLRFTLDDGTGCIQCILWLNHLTSPYFSRRPRSHVEALACMAGVYSGRVQLGQVVRVRGRVTGFRGSVQVTVDDVVVDNDPNFQVLHWLQCVSLARKYYDPLCNTK